MKKQRTLLIVLVVLLIALGGTYAALRSWNQGETDAGEEQTITVAALDSITALSISNQYGTYDFTREDEGWSYDADSTFPLDGSYLDTVADLLADLTAQRAFEEPDALSGYGLDAPTCSVGARTSAGDSLTVLVGNATGSSYYAKTDASDTVYTISGDLFNALNYQLNDLVAVEDIPAAGEAALVSLQVTRTGESFTLTKQTETVQSDAPASTADPESSAAPTQSSQPEVTYHWLLDGTAIEKGEALSTALGELAYLGFDACYQYNPDETVLAQCGLDSPALRLVVTSGESAYALDIGGTADDGSYYARLNNRGPVYLLGADSAQALMALTRDTLTTQAAA